MVETSSKDAGVVDAVAAGDLRLLILGLATATGDAKFASSALEVLCRAIDDGEQLSDGGLELQAAIIEEAARLAAASQGAGFYRPAEPSRSLLERLARFGTGRKLESPFIDRLEQDFGFTPPREEWRAPVGTNFSVVVIGAGIAGLAMSMRLREYGIKYVVYEKNPEIGGTWHENVYPGCGVDTPNHLYSFTEALNPDWTTRCARRVEILSYLRSTAERMDLISPIVFDAEVTSCRWDEATLEWVLSISYGDGRTESRRANAVVAANGSLNRAKYPTIPGIDSFQGRAFHTSRWPEDLDITGLRIGMVGNGSSGVQLGKALAEKGAHLTAFQRTPHWIIPNKMAQEVISEDERWRLREFPYYALWQRFIMSWEGGDLNYPNLIINREWKGPGINAENAKTRQKLIDYINDETGGRADLVAALTPTYPPYVKRMVWDNDWYRTVARPNVDLCTEAIVEADASGLVTADGRHHDLDVLVYATGFHGTRFLYPMEIVGRSGRTPGEIFGDDEEIRAYLGLVIRDFPNFYRISGPNSSVGHGGSSVFLSEMQTHYIQDCLRYLIEQEVAALDVSEDVVVEYNRRVDEGLQNMVWSIGGVTTRYKTASGRIATNHPWTLQHYWVKSRHIDPADYDILVPGSSAREAADVGELGGQELARR